MHHGPFLQLAERPASDRGEPVFRPRPVARRPSAKSSFEPPPVDIGQRRRIDALVPHNREDAAGTKYARNLRNRVVVREPVECLRGEDRVDRRVLQWNRFGSPGMTLCLGNDRFEDRPHSVQRLDRDHVLVASREHTG